MGFQEKCRIRLTDIAHQITTSRKKQKQKKNRCPSDFVNIPTNKFLSNQYGLTKYCTPLWFYFFILFLFFFWWDLLWWWAGHFMQIIPSASVNFAFELLNGCFLSEQAICSINVWLAVKSCFWIFLVETNRTH